MKRESKLMQLVDENLNNPAFGKEEKPKSVVTEVLVPKVIEMDADGRPMSEHETVAKPRIIEVETIPWTTWAEKETKRNPNESAKLFLLQAINSLHENCRTPCPIALVRKEKTVQALATKPLRVGELVIPLFFKKQSSVVTEDEGATIHPKAVDVVVTWSGSATATADGEHEADSSDVEVRLKVQPELKLPANGANGLKWTQSDAVHPFWFIQRTGKDESEANADLVQQDFTHVMACSFSAVTSAAAEVPPTTNTFSLSVPFLVNTQAIEVGKEVILKWKPTDNKKKHGVADTNAFDQILHKDKKQRRAKAKV